MPTKTTKKVTNKKVVDKKEEVKAVKPVEEKSEINLQKKRKHLLKK